MVDTPIGYTAHSRGSATAMERVGWGRRLYRVWQSIGRDNISIMAAGIAYYAMLSVFPGMSALVLTYGLIADPQTIERHVSTLSGVLPSEALNLLSDQLNVLIGAPAER